MDMISKMSSFMEIFLKISLTFFVHQSEQIGLIYYFLKEE